MHLLKKVACMAGPQRAALVRSGADEPPPSGCVTDIVVRRRYSVVVDRALSAPQWCIIRKCRRDGHRRQGHGVGVYWPPSQYGA
jgi:hypothetical protein